jgi:hypothetical protein
MAPPLTAALDDIRIGVSFTLLLLQPKERAHGTLRIGGWVGSRSGLVAVE